MDWLIEYLPLLIVVGYILIGVFVASFMAAVTRDEMWFPAIAIWPVIIVLFAIVGIVVIPYVLGKFMGEQLGRMLS